MAPQHVHRARGWRGPWLYPEKIPRLRFKLKWSGVLRASSITSAILSSIVFSTGSSCKRRPSGSVLAARLGQEEASRRRNNQQGRSSKKKMRRSERQKKISHRRITEQMQKHREGIKSDWFSQIVASMLMWSLPRLATIVRKGRQRKPSATRSKQSTRRHVGSISERPAH